MSGQRSWGIFFFFSRQHQMPVWCNFSEHNDSAASISKPLYQPCGFSVHSKTIPFSGKHGDPLIEQRPQKHALLNHMLSNCNNHHSLWKALVYYLYVTPIFCPIFSGVCCSGSPRVEWEREGAPLVPERERIRKILQLPGM